LIVVVNCHLSSRNRIGGNLAGKKKLTLKRHGLSRVARWQTPWKQNDMDWQELIGYLAGILTTIAVIPQISKAWKTKQVDDISLITVCVLICGLALWTLYGFVHQAWPIVITNGLSMLLNVFLFSLVIYEKRT
jgi:MtN3 and saliva related transmembrane protein